MSNQLPTKPALIDFGHGQPGPKPLAEHGYNIGKMLSRTMLEYTQGLFMNQNLPHQFSYDENQSRDNKIWVVNPNSHLELDSNAYPRIVSYRGTVNPMGKGGINNMASLNQYDGSEKKTDMFSCNMTFRIYGAYQDAERYASLLFMSLRFLTEPLKMFTIFKVGTPTMSDVKPYRKDVKPSLHYATVSVTIFKEGSVLISPKHLPVLRSFSFKCSQVFDATTGNKVIVRIS